MIIVEERRKLKHQFKQRNETTQNKTKKKEMFTMALSTAYIQALAMY